MISKQDKEIKEYQSVKYVRELTEYWNAYVMALINEIFVGVGVNIGLTEQKAYALIKNNPNELKKSNFFVDVFSKFKSIFTYKTPKFTLDEPLIKKNKPVSPAQWDIINKSIDDYWKRHTEKLNENIVVKGFLLGRDTGKMRRKRIEHRNKSLKDMQDTQYSGKMPDSIAEAYKKYDFKNSETKAIMKALGNVSMHVTEVNNQIKEVIRKNVIAGFNDEKGPSEIVSDLYWNVQKENSAVSCRRNWNRVAVTEMQSIFEAGVLAPFEAEAMESMKDIRRAQYFVFTGGSCKWCRAHQGTLVRLLPADAVPNRNNDSLSEMGINDPFTDIAIWIGKNNVGKYSYKSPEWMVCSPAHPHGMATMEPIDMETEFYNPKTERVEKKQTEQTKHVPTRKDYVIDDAEKERRKPTFVSDDRVQFNNNLYERVSPAAYERAKKEWDRNPNSAIPISTDSTRYDRIFGEAERNQTL